MKLYQSGYMPYRQINSVDSRKGAWIIKFHIKDVTNIATLTLALFATSVDTKKEGPPNIHLYGDFKTMRARVLSAFVDCGNAKTSLGHLSLVAREKKIKKSLQ